MKVYSQREWEFMLGLSRRLLNEAELQRRLGNVAKADAIWRDLRQLNREIRDKCLDRDA